MPNLERQPERDDTETGRPRIKSIKIEGLFRQYDHFIPFMLEERVTVIHGRNGVGKTAVLSLVASLFRGDYLNLVKFPFRKLKVQFTDGFTVRVISSTSDLAPADTPRGQEGPEANEAWKLEIVSQGTGDTGDVLVLDSEWLSGEVGIKFQQLFDRLRHHTPICFVGAQRMFRIDASSHQDKGPVLTPAVSEIARDLAGRIKAVDSAYRDVSTRLDDSLPSRLFASPAIIWPVPEGELERRATAVEQERQRLRRLGLLERSTHRGAQLLLEAQVEGR